MQQQNYDCFLVIDFEATCKEKSRMANQEIIEFPVLKVDATTFEVTDKFHEYIRPTHNQQLTDFCIHLTGITQEMVDQSDTFPTVFGNFQSWMVRNVGLEKRFLFVTCGDWDLKAMLPEQCKREKVVLPPYFHSWMNIKKAYASVTGSFVKGMRLMLHELHIDHVGRHHSGIDDCKNIVSILTALANLGCVFRPNGGDRRKDTPSKPPRLDPSKSFPEQPSSMKPSLEEDEREDMKHSLYPSLSEESCDEDTIAGACSKIYQPYDQEKDEEESDDQQKLIDENVNPECPNYQSIIVKLRENIASKRFKTRDQEELTCLCAAGKYLHLMETEDKLLLEARLRLFYVALCYGWKVASRDARSVSATSVGINIAPEALAHASRHQRKILLGKDRKAVGGTRRKDKKKGSGDFEFI